MDIDMAREVVRAAFRSGSELQRLLGPLKERCSPDEYRAYARGVAAAVDAIGGPVDKEGDCGLPRAKFGNRNKHSQPRAFYLTQLRSTAASAVRDDEASPANNS